MPSAHCILGHFCRPVRPSLAGSAPSARFSGVRTLPGSRVTGTAAGWGRMLGLGGAFPAPAGCTPCADTGSALTSLLLDTLPLLGPQGLQTVQTRASAPFLAHTTQTSQISPLKTGGRVRWQRGPPRPGGLAPGARSQMVQSPRCTSAITGRPHSVSSGLAKHTGREQGLLLRTQPTQDEEARPPRGHHQTLAGGQGSK